MKPPYKTYLIAMGCVLAAGAVARAADEIQVRETVVLTGSVVRLGDVADIAAATNEQQARLASLPLMPAPAPGTQRYLQRREITDLLAAHGVDLRGVRIEGAAQVAISSPREDWAGSQAASVDGGASPVDRSAVLLAGQVGRARPARLEAGHSISLREDLNQLIVVYLNTKVSEAASWSATCDVAERHLALIDAATSTLVCDGGNSPWTGRQRFVVSFHTPDGAVQLPVYAEITATSTPVVVALRPLGRGDTITAADIELRTVDYIPKTHGRGIAAESVEGLLGMEAGQTIRAGEVVFTDQVQAPVLVKRGDLISVLSHAGGIRVRTTARARQDGAKGELVQVESLDTRERFDARVVGVRAAAVFSLTRTVGAEPAERFETARR